MSSHELQSALMLTVEFSKTVYTVKPVLNGISRVQKIFPLKPGFRLIKLYYNN
jgi:hypothetical protein